MGVDLDVVLPLAAIAALTGLVRGFSGFGAALVFVPLASRVVEPWQAVIILFIVDGIAALPLLPAALQHCNWREVAPLSAGAAVTLPIGAYFLVSVDPTALRWVLSALALGVVAVMATGWRYHRPPGLLLSAAVGTMSGFLGGLASFFGPPIVLFWLGGQDSARTVRANIIVFLGVATVIGSITFWLYGRFSLALLVHGIVLIPVYGAALWIGTRLFGRASEETFRRIAYLIIAGAAISSSPAFDKAPD